MAKTKHSPTPGKGGQEDQGCLKVILDPVRSSDGCECAKDRRFVCSAVRGQSEVQQRTGGYDGATKRSAAQPRATGRTTGNDNGVSVGTWHAEKQAGRCKSRLGVCSVPAQELVQAGWG